MDIRELRIGNYVQGDGGFIDQVRKELFEIVERSINEDDILPVELTERHLFDFGFKVYRDPEDSYYTHDNGFTINRKCGFNVFYFRSHHDITEDGISSDIVQVKSVHHLQNVFFALTQKELEKTD